MSTVCLVKKGTVLGREGGRRMSFMKYMSVNQLLLKHTNSTEPWKKEKEIWVVSLDASAAFDSVWHTGLPSGHWNLKLT